MLGKQTYEIFNILKIACIKQRSLLAIVARLVTLFKNVSLSIEENACSRYRITGGLIWAKKYTNFEVGFQKKGFKSFGDGDFLSLSGFSDIHS